MIRSIYLALSLIVVSITTSFMIASTPVSAACSPDTLLGVPAWYRNLQNGDCSIKFPGNADGDMSRFIWMIVLNILQAALVVVAYIAIFFIIKGGFMYITSAGSTDGMANAKKTITNAIIGLIICIAAASIVNAIAGLIKG
ncbi:hypothetical protein IPP24_01820 [Candidatus Saccharibacteria bacterium]|nr:MAG: hypothetical protein IPP24_01820 [Candidatus Saccharibacteria bacterium]